MKKTLLFTIFLILPHQSLFSSEYEEYYTYETINFIIPKIFSDKTEKIEKGNILLVEKHLPTFSGQVSAIFNRTVGRIKLPNTIEKFKNRRKYQIGESVVVSKVNGLKPCYEYDKNLNCTKESTFHIPYNGEVKITRVQYLKMGTLLTISYNNQIALLTSFFVNTPNNIKFIYNDEFLNKFKGMCPKYYNYGKISPRYTCLSENIVHLDDGHDSWKERDEISIVYYDFLAIIIGRKYEDLFGRILRIDQINNDSYFITIEDTETFEEMKIPVVFDYSNRSVHSVKIDEVRKGHFGSAEIYKAGLRQYFK
ncbi:hypothetical protein V6Z05_14865 [Leptospira venezuelensis]|uniref:hypothetical protein n=1 Tax=Leptospira venezuelensis TaxID=1958811 RepID=UPI000A3AC6C0|nr:hypothetical protein [Leptospira venezuelensis]